MKGEKFDSIPSIGFAIFSLKDRKALSLSTTN